MKQNILLVATSPYYLVANVCFVQIGQFLRYSNYSSVRYIRILNYRYIDTVHKHILSFREAVLRQ
jgi:hypothetical protein